MSHPFLYDHAPQRVYWETTNACDLACRHCRAEARPERDPSELSTDEGRKLFAELARFGTPLPHLVLTGGDPLKRSDLFDLIGAARDMGFGVSVAPSATPLLTREAIFSLKKAGVDAISLSIDGSDPERHDFIRGIEGTFERTREAAKAAREAELPFQVNTLVCAATVDDLPAIYKEVVAIGAARWSLFFLVTVGRGNVLEPISQERAEEVLVWVAKLAAERMARPGRGGLVITTTEAPQLRRVVAEQKRLHAHEHPSPEGQSTHPSSVHTRAAEPTHGGHPSGVHTQTVEPTHGGHPGGQVKALGHDAGSQAPKNGGHGQHAHHGAGIRDGNGILFISNTGEICPSGFLEVSAGNVRTSDLVAVYRSAPLFTGLRDPDHFGGRCGICEYRHACGGSRARAFSAFGDPMAEDPLCPHEPTLASPS
ncbi:MAG: radical SAM protein [Polyangiaceae bacterium]|nr:radical SAM protein [Polyangiaceae bacterium]